MAFRPSLRSIWTLIAMAAITYGLYYWAEYSRVEARRDNYETKLIAANRMNEALRALADRKDAGSDVLESYGDSRVDAVIGQQFSTITFDLASFEEKLSGVNPNLAGAIVELLVDAKLRGGDRVAVALSGSTPGANIAMLCACEAVGVEAYTISSLTSTWWGATDPRDTWVDMQRYLLDKGILRGEILAVSRGGIDDNALGLSSIGKSELADAAIRTHSKLLETNSAGQASLLWWTTFKAAAKDRPYSAYINVGDAIASLGHKENAELLGNGLHVRLPSRNWPGTGAMHMASQENLPIINIFNAAKLAESYGLGAPRIPLADPGNGDVFTTTRYDLRVTVTALAISLAALFVLVWFDSKYFRLADAGVDPETLL